VQGKTRQSASESLKRALSSLPSRTSFSRRGVDPRLILLQRLKDEHGRARQFALQAVSISAIQQHCSVRVVTAGVHHGTSFSHELLALPSTAKETAGLLNRQRVLVAR
jgi:hypothetical protein